MCDRGPRLRLVEPAERRSSGRCPANHICDALHDARLVADTIPSPMPLNRHICNHAATCKLVPQICMDASRRLLSHPFRACWDEGQTPTCSSDINLEVFNRTAFLIIIPLVGDKGSQRRVQLHWRSSVAKLNFTKEKKDHIGHFLLPSVQIDFPQRLVALPRSSSRHLSPAAIFLEPLGHPGVVDVRGRSDFSRFDPRPERPHFGNFGPPAERRSFFVERRPFCETPPAVGL